MINSKKKGFTNVKGFTIVELVIVIAVIAILSAVLIPTFSNLVKKANMSADQQAVRQMNTVLAIESVSEKNGIFDVFEALDDAGFTAKDYRPLSTGMLFFWDQNLDRILLVDDEYNVIFPTEYADVNKASHVWKSLSQEISIKAPQAYESGISTNVEVSSGEELAYVINDINKGTSNKVLTIVIPDSGIDMLGASLCIPLLAQGAGYDITITGGTIKNAASVDVAMKKNDGDGNDGQYGCALFGVVDEGNTLTIDNVVFEDISIKNTNASGAAILVGGVYSDHGLNLDGIVNIKDVTIKNSTVIGHRSVASLVGINQGEVYLEGEIKLENVKVLTVGGRTGMLMGQNANSKKTPCTIKANTTISLTGCSIDIYKCNQNDGICPECGKNLGGTNQIHSWVVEGNGTVAHKNNGLDKNALVALGENPFSTVVSGWN